MSKGMGMFDLLNPIDKEKFKKEFLAREPFPYFCIDNFLNEDFANEVHDFFPAYQEAGSGADNQYRYGLVLSNRRQGFLLAGTKAHPDF